MARKQMKEERGMNSRGFIEKAMAIQRTTDPRTTVVLISSTVLNAA